MPVRNESASVDKALRSIRGQDFPGVYEILVVDGRSEDGTRAILEEHARQDPRVRILENPDRVTPAALNIGVRAARGEIVVRLDGRWRVASDYLARIDEAFQRTGADSLGGRIVRVPEGRVAEGIERARRTWLGGGLSSRNDPSTPAGFVREPNIATCWRRNIMLRVGAFDESLIKNQDDEYNARLLLAGFTTYYEPEFSFEYSTPRTLRQLYRQLYGYAFYGLDAALKKGPLADWRSRLMPGVALSVCVMPFVLAAVNPAYLLGMIASYLAIVALATVSAGPASGAGGARLSTLMAFPTIHAAVLWGSAIGALRTLVRAGAVRRAGSKE